MFSSKKHETHIEQQLEKHSNKINELEIQLEKLDRDVGNFLNGLNVSAEQLTSFIESKENFSEKNWTELVDHKSKLDSKLKLELENIRNPLKTKKTYANLHVERHWLHVR
jgi:hypothetical protein